MDYDREMDARRTGEYPICCQEAEDYPEPPADDTTYPEGWGWPWPDEAVADERDFDHATGENVPTDSWFTVAGVYYASIADADRARQLLAARTARDAARSARREAAQSAPAAARRAA